MTVLFTKHTYHSESEVGTPGYCKICKSSMFRRLNLGCEFCKPEGGPFQGQPTRAKDLGQAIRENARRDARM